MGVLIDGAWRDEELPQEMAQSGELRGTETLYQR